MHGTEPDWKQKIYDDLDRQNKYALTLKTCFEQAKKSAQNDIQAIQNKLLADTNKYETIIKELSSRLTENGAGSDNSNPTFNLEAIQSQTATLYANKEIERLKQEISKLLQENRDLQEKLDRSPQNVVPLMRYQKQN